MDKSTCSIPSCELPIKSKGYCNAHYLRWYRSGDPLAGRYPVGADHRERIRAATEVADNGCWEWRFGRDKDGYGKLKLDRRDVRAHRYAYEVFRGPIPDGLVLDHLCRNPPCVNPDHLEVVTAVENSARGNGISALNARKTHCKRGHEFTPENTRHQPGGRDCWACYRIRSAKWSQRRKERGYAASGRGISGLGSA